MADLADLFAPRASILRSLDASAGTTSAVNTRSFEAILLLLDPLVVVGSTASAVLQHSGDGSTDWEDVPGTVLTATTGQLMIGVEVRTMRLRRFVRARVSGVNVPSYKVTVVGWAPRDPEDKPSLAWLPKVLGPAT
jgi:hypothetical protein